MKPQAGVGESRKKMLKHRKYGPPTVGGVTNERLVKYGPPTVGGVTNERLVKYGPLTVGGIISERLENNLLLHIMLLKGDIPQMYLRLPIAEPKQVIGFKWFVKVLSSDRAFFHTVVISQNKLWTKTKSGRSLDIF